MLSQKQSLACILYKEDTTAESALKKPTSEPSKVPKIRTNLKASACRQPSKPLPLISAPVSSQRGTTPIISTSAPDADRIQAHTAKARSAYQIISQVYHYERTFEQAAADHQMSMEELGLQLAVFAMQTMQGLRAKGTVNNLGR